MRITANINSLNLIKLTTASEILNISRNELISILLTRMANDSVFKVKPYKTAQYQDSNPDIIWITMTSIIFLLLKSLEIFKVL